MSKDTNLRRRFSIALVNYKSFEVTKICLDLIKKAVNVSETPVWVVDNNSNDESLDYLRSLEWINLIERKPSEKEVGFMAHGRALDLALEKTTTDFILLMHTDTFIYDSSILDILLEKCVADDKIVAVGCMEPVCRSIPHTIVRTAMRSVKYYFRKLKVTLGISTRRPKPHYETHMKSFCALWNVNTIKRHGMTFSMGNEIPGYAMQDQLRKLDYKFVAIPPREMFSYLDHVEKGTASEMAGVRLKQRKADKYQKIIEKTKAVQNADL